MDKDLDTLEEALDYFAQAMSRPRLWQTIQKSANVTIDRPGAHLLKALINNDNGCKLHELAVKIGVEAPSVSRTVHRLEGAKMITRTVDATDHRATHLQLTPEGLRTLDCLRQAKRERLKALLSSWSVEDRQDLVRLLHRLARQTSEISDPASTNKPLVEATS